MDFIKHVRELENAGFKRKQAETQIKVMDTFMKDFATKDDIFSVQTEMKSMQVDIKDLRSDIKNLRTDIKDLRTDFKDLENNIDIRFKCMELSMRETFQPMHKTMRIFNFFCMVLTLVVGIIGIFLVLR